MAVSSNNRLHLPIAPVTRLAGASLAPWPLRGPRLQVKPTLEDEIFLVAVYRFPPQLLPHAVP